MSQLLIQKYLNELSDLKKVSGTARESVVREAFKDLLKGMGRSHDLVFIPEHQLETAKGAKIYVDAGRRARALTPRAGPTMRRRLQRG